MNRRFFDWLGDRIAAVDSVLSVGLDPDPARIPDHLADHDLPRWAFNRRIIDATHEHAACFKPNAAFYEDPDGWRALEETIAYAHGKDVPVLLDAKRADIGNTARQYARVVGDGAGTGVGVGVSTGVGASTSAGASTSTGAGSSGRQHTADAITVNPYLGQDALQPFLSKADAGVFVLCRTSNPGGADFQNLAVGNDKTLYEYVAQRAAEWNANGNVGLVVGATAPEELERVRELVPDLPFLVPGVGAQGGDVEAAVEYGLADGGPADGVGLVNSSRGIIFAGDGETFDRAAGEAAKRAKQRLNAFR